MPTSGSRRSSGTSSGQVKRLSSGPKTEIPESKSDKTTRKMSGGTSEIKKPGFNSRSRVSKKMDKISQTMRSGLTFPHPRIRRMLKRGHYAKRVGEDAAIFLTAALEYMTAEVLELAGNVAKEENRKRISPKHICTAIGKDRELQNLLQNVTVAHGGVVPYIESLKEEKGQKKKTKKKK